MLPYDPFTISSGLTGVSYTDLDFFSDLEKLVFRTDAVPERLLF